jgi:crotonobetainyl-CoA:carnitine CoA-transferase CaiB-like acyl-CoA transferase
MLSSKPLDGITIIEIGHSVAGPYAGMILGDLGADVLKVEQPGGDYARGWGPPFAGKDAALFAAVNRSKKSVVLDLSTNEGRERLLKLVESADVLLHNLKFGALERLELGAAKLMARNSRLILCNLGAYGSEGPLRERPGYDPMVQAASGLMSILGEAGRPPVRVPLSFMDMSAGMWAALGILAALRDRDSSGSGGVVDTSLYEAALAWMGIPITSHLCSGELPERLGSAHPTIVPTQAFEAADGWIMIAAGNDAQFARLAAVMGKPELAGDPRFTNNSDRVVNRDTLIAIIADCVRAEDRFVWAARLDEAGVPCSLIATIDEVVSHPQTAALGIVQASPGGGPACVGLPLQFDGTRPAIKRAAPALGADTDHVLADDE